MPNCVNLDEVLGRDTDERSAFVVTKSLNPMQSVVFMPGTIHERIYR